MISHMISASQSPDLCMMATWSVRAQSRDQRKQASLSTKESLLTVRLQWVSCIFNHFICLPGWRTYNRNPSHKTSERLEKWDVTFQETTQERQNVQTTTRGSAQTMSATKNRKHSETVNSLTPGTKGKALHTCFFNPRILWGQYCDGLLSTNEETEAQCKLSHPFRSQWSRWQGWNRNTDGPHPV